MFVNLSTERTVTLLVLYKYEYMHVYKNAAPKEFKEFYAGLKITFMLSRHANETAAVN